MDLFIILTWLVSQGGAPVAAYWLVDHIKRLQSLPPEPKRYWAIGLTAFIAMLGYAAQLGMGYEPLPQGTRDWIEAFFYVGMASFSVVLNQVIHARRDLRGKPAA